ncbi:unnamed protein product [Oppiella nova]|uniref:Nose resistant-to-fluoxetine protein N-terminal domain-containing protein n=1 Tax=Oppiella nova TaxID=334625 RepID=A0A7R9QQT2_9ACAR|nr:unnamed protein product [Oppiella nova]CAG2171666.1 unnamed protein product [Oppiella nova]
MGKIPPGLFDGVITSFGDYDECLSIRSEHSITSDTIYGKYCLIRPVIPLNNTNVLLNFKGLDILNNETNALVKNKIKQDINKIKMVVGTNLVTDKVYGFHYGVCIPSQCQARDVEKVLNTGAYPQYHDYLPTRFNWPIMRDYYIL